MIREAEHVLSLIYRRSVFSIEIIYSCQQQQQQQQPVALRMKP